jgi:D-alanyl-D-alanine carboxypeptidase/D-alanyl-D-alanine-endopeptidase (penicillin-binding protein 4)
LLAAACFTAAQAADPLPAAVRTTLQRTGLPLGSFGVYARPVDGDETAPLAALNAEQAYVLASTTKLVTSLAALDLLGSEHRWQTLALANGPVRNGRLAGDLWIVGGNAGLGETELRDWFQSMRSQGLVEVAGNIVLDRVTLLHEDNAPVLAPMPAAERWREPDPLTYNHDAIVVAVQPGAGRQADVTLRPHPPGIVIVNEVSMRGRCGAWARWAPSNGPRHASAQLVVSGQWDDSCGRQEIAFVRPPPTWVPAPALALSSRRQVATLWAETGGRLRGRVIEAAQPSRRASARAWSVHESAPLPQLIRAINKTSNNIAARSLLLALAPDMPPRGTALRGAQDRVHAWLRRQGLADGDIRIDAGSGQSHAERGKPRAMVQLLRNAWRASAADAFIDSLPIAGVDGTLAHRMQRGLATGQAYLKTGTLSNTRALAGYVRAKSGTVYAVAAMVNHPDAARATPALDAFIEWVAANG